MSQMGLLRTKVTRFCWILQSSVIPRLKLRRPDIVLIDKTMTEVKIADVTIPGDERVNEREVGKIEKYKVLKDEIARRWDMKEVIVIPVVVGALGAISAGFEKYISTIGIEMRVKNAQKKALLGTARILRLVLGWQKTKSIIVSITVQDSVRPLITGCCLLSQNKLEQLATTL